MTDLIDLDSLYSVEAHGEGAEFQVQDQLGNKLDCYITIAGGDSKVWNEAWSKAKHKVMKGEEVVIEMMTAIALDWRGFAHNGEEVPFSKTAVAKLFKEAPYIAQQADKFLGDRANFMKAAKPH